MVDIYVYTHDEEGHKLNEYVIKDQNDALAFIRILLDNNVSFSVRQSIK